MFFTKATASATLLAAVKAHMIMTQPSPFDPSALNNSPLDASGSDFPCKFNGVYTATGGSVNQFALGSSQPLSFTGSAVHGGGSCQVSITYDNPPTKSSTWKVIHSIEGGCPARNTDGNLPPNAGAEDPFKYQFKIPDNIPTGNGTIAWTWLNRIGNREMYMNCGALELTGSGGSQSAYDALPDMVVLNIAGHPSTIEGVDYKFAEPGPSCEDNTGPFGVATCSNDGCVMGDTAGSCPEESGSSPQPTPTSTAGGVFLTTTTAAAHTTTAPVHPTTTAVAHTTTTTSAPTSTSKPSSGSGALTGPCSPEGTWNCIGGTAFQQCGSGQWSAVTPMTPGLVCTPGQSMTLTMAPGRRRRAFRA